MHLSDHSQVGTNVPIPLSIPHAAHLPAKDLVVGVAQLGITRRDIDNFLAVKGESLADDAAPAILVSEGQAG